MLRAGHDRQVRGRSPSGSPDWSSHPEGRVLRVTPHSVIFSDGLAGVNDADLYVAVARAVEFFAGRPRAGGVELYDTDHPLAAVAAERGGRAE